MILGIGTDIIATVRFEKWTKYSQGRLLKIFSAQELLDCQRQDGSYLIEKLAVRFAAKEAFYKALSATLVTLKQTHTTFSFLSITRSIIITYVDWGVPSIVFDWAEFFKRLNTSNVPLQVHLSLSHEKTHVLAFVVITMSVASCQLTA